MTDWIITLEVWTHFSLEPKKAVEEEVGGRHREFTLPAADFDDACRVAKLIGLGILSHAKVWQVRVTSIAMARTARERADA